LSNIVQDIRPTSATTVLVEFDGPISDLKKYLNPDIYSFTNGLQALGVIVCGDKEVEIITTEQQQDTLYELALSQDD
jgi:hypothetical protein